MEKGFYHKFAKNMENLPNQVCNHFWEKYGEIGVKIYSSTKNSQNLTFDGRQFYYYMNS